MRKLILIATLLGAMLSAVSAQASGEVFTATNPKWKSECASCHVAYPARLLPAESWRALMGGLDKHFGTDASVDAVTNAEILGFLEKNASRRKPEPVAKPILRITETRWYIKEHDEIAARTWKDPRVKSAANCAACHTQAENGDFSERNLRVPK